MPRGAWPPLLFRSWMAEIAATQVPTTTCVHIGTTTHPKPSTNRAMTAQHPKTGVDHSAQAP